MFPYGFPQNYNPHHPRTADPPAAIPANVITRAKLTGASHVSKDGTAAYVHRYQKWYRCDWQGLDYGCWWGVEGEPEGLVKL